MIVSAPREIEILAAAETRDVLGLYRFDVARLKEDCVNATELKKWLGATELFQNLSKRSLNQLVKAGREVRHPDGHEVIIEGAGAVGFHLITAGTARVTTGSVVRRTLSVGDSFGEISVIDGRPRSASVEAISNLVTFAIDSNMLKQLITDNPDFAHHMLVMLCSRLRDAEKRAG
jgi:CRP-like cAMP-binding protein